MFVKVDYEKCNGCNRCVEYCPEDVLRNEDGKINMKYPDECWRCGVCSIECPQDAVRISPPVGNRIMAINNSDV